MGARRIVARQIVVQTLALSGSSAAPARRVAGFGDGESRIVECRRIKVCSDWTSLKDAEISTDDTRKAKPTSVGVLSAAGSSRPEEDSSWPPGSKDETSDRHSRLRSDQLALWAFIAGALGCFAAFVWIARFEWFVGDEWDFLSTRTAGNLSDLFTPHNEHWSTLPILEYRLLWQVVGLRSYLPYLVVVVMLHITVAALLRVVMRRAGVSPWISTVAALIFALFGAGYDNIVWAFQSGYDGSLVFGLISLLLADHRGGRIDRRDILAVFAGLAALMCSGVGVTMVILVAIAVFVRRGPRCAVAYAAPLAGVYLLWLVLVGHEAYRTAHITVEEYLRFVITYMGATFSSIGHLTGMGLVLGALLVVGLWIAWFSLAATERRKRLAAPGALLIGSLVFVMITGIGRAGPTMVLVKNVQGNPQYLGVTAALVLPALAIAADAVIHRWSMLTPVVLVALVIGIPGNISILTKDIGPRASFDGYREFILSLPRLAGAQQVPSSIHPDPAFDPYLTMGWLRAGERSGRIPPPGPVPTEDRANWTLALDLEATSHRAQGDCAAVALPATVRLGEKDTITFRSPTNVTYLARNGVRSAPHVFGGLQPTTYESYGDMTIESVSAAKINTVALLCKSNQEVPS
jgi:hypothetical protein